MEAPDVRDFLVDADAVARHTERTAREWVLVRERDGEVEIGVYVDPDDLARIEAMHPADAVADALPAYCTVLEGISHFILLFRRASRDEPVSLLELETQAEVDKYVTASLHAGPRSPAHASELKRRLFGDARLGEGLTAEERERYTAAGRLAERYCGHLDRLGSVDARLAELRRFYRMSGPARMERLRRAA